MPLKKESRIATDDYYNNERSIDRPTDRYYLTAAAAKPVAAVHFIG